MNSQLLEAFNRQINNEFYSAYLYFAMATYFDEIAMCGFSTYMKEKASEKLKCAQVIYDYIILRDEKLTFFKIDEPQNDWINVSDVFSAVLSQEENLLSQLQRLYKIAKDAEDIAGLEFISVLIDKQIRNQGTARKVMFRIKNSNIISSNIEYLDGIINEMKI